MSCVTQVPNANGNNTASVTQALCSSTFPHTVVARGRWIPSRSKAAVCIPLRDAVARTEPHPPPHADGRPPTASTAVDAVVDRRGSPPSLGCARVEGPGTGEKWSRMREVECHSKEDEDGADTSVQVSDRQGHSDNRYQGPEGGMAGGSRRRRTPPVTEVDEPRAEARAAPRLTELELAGPWSREETMSNSSAVASAPKSSVDGFRSRTRSRSSTKRPALPCCGKALNAVTTADILA